MQFNARVTALSIACGITLFSHSSALSFDGQNAHETRNSKPTSTKAPVAAGANDLDESPSEMRAMIERYAVDRFALGRFFSVETSPTRQARLNQFYTDWLAALRPLNFDAMSQ